jgi:hypothetical protein
VASGIKHQASVIMSLSAAIPRQTFSSAVIEAIVTTVSIAAASGRA